MPLPFDQFEPSHLLTSREEIEDLFSIHGVELHSEHIDPERESDFFSTLVHRATAQILSYIGSRYRLADLSTHPRIREIATYWAAYKLSHHRGNPSLFESEYVEGLEDLELMRQGIYFLDIPTTPRAVVQSGVVDLRACSYRLQPIHLGTSYTYPNQRQLRIYYWPFNWL